MDTIKRSDLENVWQSYVDKAKVSVKQ